MIVVHHLIIIIIIIIQLSSSFQHSLSNHLHQQGHRGTNDDLANTKSMSRDPFYTSIPDAKGLYCLTKDGEIGLYYELRGLSNASTKAILVMGAFGTLRWLDHLADMIAAQNIQVLTFDHRHVGASAKAFPSSAAGEAHTHSSEGLAKDAWRLMVHVWGPEARNIHVYGVSMGGMIAQQICLQDLRRKVAALSPLRIKSLFLAVTSRGIHHINGFHHVCRWVLPFAHRRGLVHLTVPLIIHKDKDRMLQHLLNKCFGIDYLASLHPTSGETMRTVWEREWSTNYELWNTFHDMNACASHMMVLATHHLEDSDAMLLRESGVPITVQIATQDRLVPPHRQKALAEVLQAKKVVYVEGGHMLDSLTQEVVWEEVMAHFNN